MNNIRLANLEHTIQLREHPVVEAQVFAQVMDFHPTFIESPVEVPIPPLHERNDYWLIPLTIQATHDVYGHTLGATRA
jgi:hypothetical protein